MKRFVILLNHVTEAQNAEFKKFVTESSLGYWHWLPNNWLLFTRQDNPAISAAALRDKVGEYYPGVRCLVLELNKDGDTWAGHGPNRKERNMFTWIHKNWKRET